MNRLPGHEGGVTCLCVAVDDRRVISASNDCKLRVWNWISGHLVILESHSSAVTCIVTLKDSSHVISGSKDKTAKLWNIDTGACEKTFSGHEKAIGCVAATRNTQTVVTGSDDFTLRVWDQNLGNTVHTLKAHNDTIKCIGITHDDRYVIAGSHEAKDQLRVWDLQFGTCVRSLKGHTHAVMNLTVLGNDHLLVTSSRDGTIKVWETNSWKLLDSFDFQSQVKYFALSPVDECYALVAVTKSGTVGILSLSLPQDWRALEWKCTKKEEPGDKIIVQTEGFDENEEHQSGHCCSCSRCCNKCVFI